MNASGVKSKFNWKTLFVVLILFLLGIAFIINQISSSLAFYLNLGLILISFCLIISLKFDTKKVAAILTTAFLFRLVLAFLAEAGLDPGLPGRAKNGRAFLEDGYKHYIQYFNPELSFDFKFYSEKWVNVIEYLYISFGPNKLNVLAFNCMLGTLVTYEVYLITKRVWNDKAAFVSATIYAIFPYLAGLSAVALREMVIIYPTILSFRFFLQWYEQQRMIDFFFAIIAIIIGMAFHGGVIILFFLYVIYFFKKSINFKTKRGISVGSFSLLSLVAILLVAFQLEIGRSKLGYFYRVYYGTNEQHETFENLIGSTIEKSTNKYRQSFVPSSFGAVAKEIPKIIIPFYFTPYPWMIAFISYFNGLLSILVLILFFIYRKKLLRNKLARITLIASILIMLIYAIGTSEHAAAIRHRAKAIPFMLIAFAPFFARFYHFLLNKKAI